MEKMVETKCVNGKCVGCGSCCTELLPMTLKEVEIIAIGLNVDIGILFNGVL